MCSFFLASQLMNQQSVKSLQVALACQVAQKNALMSAVKLACVCRWAESETSAAEVGLTDPTHNKYLSHQRCNAPQPLDGHQYSSISCSLGQPLKYQHLDRL